MDSVFSLNFTTLALVVPLLFFFLLKKWKKKSKPLSWDNPPPGPKTLPIIGNLNLMTSLPFRCFRDLAKQYGPVMLLKLGEVPTIIVSSREAAREVLKDHDPNFTDRPESIVLEIVWYNYKDIAFSPYGDYWRQMRKICIMELLSPKNVRSYGTIRNDEISRFIDSIQMSAGEPINFTEKIFSCISSITCRATFGKVCKGNDGLVKLLNDAIQLASGFELADMFPSSTLINVLSWNRLKLMMMRRKLDAILDDIIEKHKGKKNNGEFGGEDLVDVFLRLKESKELQFEIGNDNMKAVINDMFGAGTETSSTTIDWTMAELMRNPRVMAKAQAEVREVFKGSKIIEEQDIQKLKYLKLVLKESLRMHPPIPIIPRVGREDRVVSGYTIPARTKVIVNSWGLQRDPKYWTNPESFEPERFENKSFDFVGGDCEYLPFGAGKRMCPGTTFGMSSVEFVLTQVLYHFDWKLPKGVEPETLDMAENPGLSATRKAKLVLVATPYDSQLG